MTHVTCRLTAENRDQLRNPTLGNRISATFTFFTLCSSAVYLHLCFTAYSSWSQRCTPASVLVTLSSSSSLYCLLSWFSWFTASQLRFEPGSFSWFFSVACRLQPKTKSSALVLGLWLSLRTKFQSLVLGLESRAIGPVLGFDACVLVNIADITTSPWA